ncbi:hypothetical protein [Streptomyces sp. NPDC055055]
MTDDTEKARAYLWELQTQIAEATGLRYPKPGTGMEKVFIAIARTQGFSDEQVEWFARTGVAELDHWPPCGPDEHRVGYSLIHSLADRLEKVLAGPFTRPVLGMLSTGEVNAVTLLAPDSPTHIVAFENELLNFANLFAKAVALAIPHEIGDDGWYAFHPDSDDVHRHLRDSPLAVRRFRDVVLAYLIEGKPSKAPAYMPSEAVGALSSVLRDGMELFVLGHEYGHVAAGHVADRRVPRRMLGIGSVPVAEIAWRREQEAEADVIGWSLCLAALGRGCGLELSHAGVELFFAACEVLNRSVSLLMQGASAPLPASSTHPPAVVRRDLLREHAEKILGEKARPLLEYGTLIHEIVDVLWEQTAPVILDLHRQGVVPDARWTANLQ